MIACINGTRNVLETAISGKHWEVVSPWKIKSSVAPWREIPPITWTLTLDLNWPTNPEEFSCGINLNQVLVPFLFMSIVDSSINIVSSKFSLNSRQALALAQFGFLYLILIDFHRKISRCLWITLVLARKDQSLISLCKRYSCQKSLRCLIWRIWLKILGTPSRDNNIPIFCHL